MANALLARPMFMAVLALVQDTEGRAEMIGRLFLRQQISGELDSRRRPASPCYCAMILRAPK